MSSYILTLLPFDKSGSSPEDLYNLVTPWTISLNLLIISKHSLSLLDPPENIDFARARITGLQVEFSSSSLDLLGLKLAAKEYFRAVNFLLTEKSTTSRIRLLAMDLDSTIIHEETIDLMAERLDMNTQLAIKVRVRDMEISTINLFRISLSERCVVSLIMKLP